MKKWKECYQILALKPWWSDKKNLRKTRTEVSLLMCLVAGVMLMLNIVNQSWLMTITSIILVLGFLASAITAGVFNRVNLSEGILALLVCLIFSFFAISGGNEGFAILWMVLVPAVAVNLLGVKKGVLTSLYFLIFVFVLFYTPLNVVIEGKYTYSFATKFPILFLCDCVISLFLSLQKEYYNRKVHLQSYMDELTGTYNRRYFMDYVMNADHTGKENLCIMVIDINGLKDTNDSLGHEAGDEQIAAVAKCCRKALGAGAILCRIGGDEFVVAVYEPDEAVKEMIEKLKKEENSWRGTYCERLHFSLGWASLQSDPGASAKELFNKADMEMYQNKVEFYRQREHDRRRS